MSYYSVKQQRALTERFGEEVFPLLDAAGQFLRDYEKTPPGTVQQCSRSLCHATRAIILEAGKLVWTSVLGAGQSSQCKDDDHEWRLLKEKNYY